MCLCELKLNKLTNELVKIHKSDPFQQQSWNILEKWCPLGSKKPYAERLGAGGGSLTGFQMTLAQWSVS